AGDGTTTATVLAQAFVNEGLRNVAAGAAPGQLKRGIETAVESVSEQLGTIARDVADSSEIAHVAGLSAQSEEIGKLIADAFDKGFLSPHFVTDADRQEAVLSDALILINQGKISNIQELLPVLEKVQQAGKPLFIVAEDIEGEALSTLVVNKLRGIINVAAVK